MKSRKEVNHSYYLRKIKPFRQKKEPVGYHSFVCPVCKRRSFMRNLKYTQPFSVDYVMFTGDRGIKWFRGKFDPDQRKLIIALIKVKLIQAVREFGLTAEDLGLIKIEYIRANTPIRETPTIKVQIPTIISSSLNKIGGLRYGRKKS
jgi:hypothetical protein